MTDLLRDQIAVLVAEGIRGAQESGALPGFEMPQIVVERPRQSAHGDYASPVCLRLGQEARMSPRDIAMQVIEHVPSSPYVSKVEVAGPGYINITLDDGWLAEQVEVILEAGETFGNSETGRGQKAQLEFVSANPTGPLTVGRVRGGVMGDTLANLLVASGYQVEREYYFNNAGRQMDEAGRRLARVDAAVGELASTTSESSPGVREIAR